MTVLIVGGGLAGSITERVLNESGVETMLFDCGNSLGASQASENLYDMGWEDRDTERSGLFVLNKYFRIQEIKFFTKSGRKSLLHVPIQDVLTKNAIRKKVVKVDNGRVILEDGTEHKGVVVVAAGVWSRDLLYQAAPLRGLVGHGFVFSGQTAPRYEYVAPFRQKKIFNISPDSFWFGDSTGVDERNYDPVASVNKSMHIAVQSGIDSGKLLQVKVGWRPYVRGLKTGLFTKVADGLYLMTGGKKLGMIRYAAQATQLMTSLGLNAK